MYWRLRHRMLPLWSVHIRMETLSWSKSDSTQNILNWFVLFITEEKKQQSFFISNPKGHVRGRLGNNFDSTETINAFKKNCTIVVSNKYENKQKPSWTTKSTFHALSSRPLTLLYNIVLRLYLLPLVRFPIAHASWCTDSSMVCTSSGT